MTITLTRKYIAKLDRETVLEMFAEAESFEQTGVLAEDSKIRNATVELFAENSAMLLTIFCGEVYMHLAREYVKATKEKEESEEE